jgi:hypothetical protein
VGLVAKILASFLLIKTLDDVQHIAVHALDDRLVRLFVDKSLTILARI